MAGKSENSLAWEAPTGGKSENSLAREAGGKSERSTHWKDPRGGGNRGPGRPEINLRCGRPPHAKRGEYGEVTLKALVIRAYTGLLQPSHPLQLTLVAPRHRF